MTCKLMIAVPVCEVLALCTGLTMSKELNYEQVHLINQLFARILTSIELRGCQEGIDQDERRFGRAVWIGHLVASINAAEACYVNGHCVGYGG
jgi:hypothetical protein